MGTACFNALHSCCRTISSCCCLPTILMKKKLEVQDALQIKDKQAHVVLTNSLTFSGLISREDDNNAKNITKC